MRMLIGTTTVTMLAHQPGVETSNAVVMEVWSSSASGTAARAVLRKELVDAGRPPNTKDGAHKVTNANAISRVGSSTSLEAIVLSVNNRLVPLLGPTGLLITDDFDLPDFCLATWQLANSTVHVSYVFHIISCYSSCKLMLFHTTPVKK